MKLCSILTAICTASMVGARVVRTATVLSRIPEQSLVPRIDQPVVPPEDQVDRNGQFPDGTWACMISPSDPDPFAAHKQCQTYCPANANSSYDGVGATIGCVGATYSSGPNMGELIQTFDGQTLGKCHCTLPVVELFVHEVVVALPEIATIACHLIYDSLSAVLNLGMVAFPPTRLLDAAMAALVQGAAILSAELLDDLDVIPAFSDWLGSLDITLCGEGNDITSQIDSWFEPLVMIGGGRGLKTGPRRPKHSSDPSVVTSEIPEPTKQPAQSASAETASVTNSATEQPSYSSTSALESSSSSAGACGLVKRDREVGKSVWTNCENDKTTHVTSITSIAFGAKETTFSSTCSEKWSHACAHYKSVLDTNVVKGWDALKCKDSLGKASVDSKRPITKQWNDDHHPGWRNDDYTTHHAECQRDEYPPAYFFDDTDPEIQNKEQLVRLLVADQNQGAGQMWAGFCFRHGLDAQDNEMDIERKAQADSSTVNQGTTIFHTYVTASISYKPVFTIAKFELGELEDTKDYGLADNPCIPLAIVNDPLYPLLRSDPAVNDGANWQYDYTSPPDQSLVDAAQKFLDSNKSAKRALTTYVNATLPTSL